MQHFLFTALLLVFSLAFGQTNPDTSKKYHEVCAGAGFLPFPFNYHQTRLIWVDLDGPNAPKWVPLTDSIVVETDSTAMTGWWTAHAGYQYAVTPHLLLGGKVGYSSLYSQRINKTWLRNDSTGDYDLTQALYEPCQRFTYVTGLVTIAGEFHPGKHVSVGAQGGLGASVLISREWPENLPVEQVTTRTGVAFEVVPFYLKMTYPSWWVQGMVGFGSFGVIQLSTGFRL